MIIMMMIIIMIIIVIYIYEENKLAVKDAEDAQAALSQAVAVLESFYKELYIYIYIYV